MYLPSLQPKPYSYVDRTLLITGVLLDMYFYSKWIASTERVVDRVGVAVGVWLNCQLSEANCNGHLYVGDLAGVHSMEFRGILFSEVSNVLEVQSGAVKLSALRVVSTLRRVH